MERLSSHSVLLEKRGIMIIIILLLQGRGRGGESFVVKVGMSLIFFIAVRGSSFAFQSILEF